MKTTTLQKLSAYTTAAASVLLQEHAKAQILYTNPPNDFIVKKFECHEYDLNSDGIYDFKIMINDRFIELGFEANAGAGWAFIDVDCESSARGVLALDKGDLIDKYRPWEFIGYYARCGSSATVAKTFISNEILCGDYYGCH